MDKRILILLLSTQMIFSLSAQEDVIPMLNNNMETIASEDTLAILPYDSLVPFAKQYLGASYAYGAIGPDRFDCSGFVCFCFARCGIELPHTSAGQVCCGEPVKGGKENLEPGDLLFFKHKNRIHHVGIFVEKTSAGTHRFIHSSTRYGVSYSSLEDEYWERRYKSARRLRLSTLSSSCDLLIE